MKRILLALSLLVAAPAFSTPIYLTANITADQAVPPTSSAGFGTGAFVFDDVSHILTWAIVITDVLFGTPESETTISGPAPVGFTGPSIAAIGFGTLKLGSIDLDDVCVVPATCVSELLSSLWYVNVATEGNPSGEIRGQIMAVPEAATSAMMAMGLVGLFVAGRRHAA